MAIAEIIVVIFGLCLFEIISSVDNAIINAHVFGRRRSRPMGPGNFAGCFLTTGQEPWPVGWTAMDGNQSGLMEENHE